MQAGRAAGQRPGPSPHVLLAPSLRSLQPEKQVEHTSSVALSLPWTRTERHVAQASCTSLHTAGSNMHEIVISNAEADTLTRHIAVLN
jgi:hypothetical protein